MLGQGLAGRRALIVGPGRIGREAGRLFKALGLQVEFSGRGDRALLSKLKRAQVLSLHLPLTPDTHHWLNATRLRLLPKDAIVLNTGRGALIDEAALTRTLKERRIFGAGLDVFENEPRIPAALRRLENVVLAPHLGSATLETRRAMARLAVQGTLAILAGQRPQNETKTPRT
jgi:glyoxylate reductase